MTTVNVDDVSAALGYIRTMLASDGYHFKIEVGGSSVCLTVEATPDACKECLVPKPTFSAIILEALKEGGVPLASEQLRLIYPSDDDLP